MLPHCLEDATSIHDCWELSQRTYHCEESSSLVVRDLLAMTHHWEESSSLVVCDPLAMTHHWEESSSLAVHGPLATTPLASNPLASAQLQLLLQLGDHPPLLILPGLVAHIDVFVDDFIGLAQGSRCWCRNIWWCIMHAVDDVFAQRDADTMH